MRFNLGDKVRLIKTNEVGVIRSFECTYDPYRELDYKYTIDVESFFLQLYNRIVQIHDNHPFRTNNEVICYDENEMELVEKSNKQFFGGCELINNEEVKEVAKVNRFKIGDRVRCWDAGYSEYGVDYNGEWLHGVIEGVGWDSCRVKLDTSDSANRFERAFFEKDLELVVETKDEANVKELVNKNKEFKFNIGDKVIVINKQDNLRKFGEMGIIITVNDPNSILANNARYIPYRAKFSTLDKFNCYERDFFEAELELADNNENTSELANIETNLKPTINTQESQLPNELDDLDIELFEYLQSEIDSDNFNYLDKLIG